MTQNLSRDVGPSDPHETAPRRPLTGRTVLFGLVAFFGVVASVNAVMVTAAVTTFGGVETRSSYQAGLAFAREIAASHAQQARNWQVDARVHPEAGGQVRIELAALDSLKRPLAGYEASMLLAHPTSRRLDTAVEVRPEGAGRFTGRATAAPGQWDLVVELARDGERLFRSRQRIVLKSVDRP